MKDTMGVETDSKNINAEYFMSGKLRIKLTNHFKKNGKTIEEILADRIVSSMRNTDVENIA